MRWESSFSSLPYQKQYIFHTLLTQNAKVRIYKLHMHTLAHLRTHTHAHIHIHTNLKETTKDVISFYGFLLSAEKTNVLALILPYYRNGF